ncbi:threonine/serine dehydratase [bacterium]|nr:threonine/serine dehydratase [bacterium]
MLAINRDTINTAEKLIRPHIRKTPIIEMRSAEIGIDSVEVVLKLELFQHSGSFKPRGAFTNMLMRDVPSSGVVAASGGNHGAAVAYAAMKLNKPAKIFVPTVASPAKMNRIRSYGADLVVTGERYAESLLASEEWATKTGALPIHAYDQPETLLGQGTVAAEFHDQDPNLDTLLVAVGGGGLIGGMAAWYAGDVKIIGVEPENAPTLAHALRAGHPVDAPAGGVAADSLAPKRVGELMFPIVKKYVSNVALVSDDAIVQTQKFLWDRLRIVAEPGGAAALSALLSKQYVPQKSERIGVVVCGGNTEAVRFE